MLILDGGWMVLMKNEQPPYAFVFDGGLMEEMDEGLVEEMKDEQPPSKTSIHSHFRWRFGGNNKGIGRTNLSV